MNENHPFTQFLEEFIPELSLKHRRLMQLSWILETTGSLDASKLTAELSAEVRLLFSDKKMHEKLLAWDADPSLIDPIKKRELNVLIRSFKPNLLPKELIENLAKTEAALGHLYTNFRPKVDGQALSENEIRAILKEEKDQHKRKKVWEASKQIGKELAPSILELVRLRNKAAKSLGYSDYFSMELELQEVDPSWLFNTLDELVLTSDSSYQKTLSKIEESQAIEFTVDKKSLGPWAWKEPFCQEDPLEPASLDALMKGLDLVKVSEEFFAKMGEDVSTILASSDLFEREGKNQHAFCINIDRDSDIRTLNNVKPTSKWLETLLHELGHAVYEQHFDASLPWLLREPPHMITTEAMALIAGRRAYLNEVLSKLPTYETKDLSTVQKAQEGLKRRQLIFSRFVCVMTYFEKELYKDPEQDLNALWWHLVKKYQGINPPESREGAADWAAKYHIGLAPAYYFSYLLGELFASSLEEEFTRLGEENLFSEISGQFLREKLFSKGNALSWSDLIIAITGKPLNSAAWSLQFC